jgi:predicted transcriptional regulator
VAFREPLVEVKRKFSSEAQDYLDPRNRRTIFARLTEFTDRPSGGSLEAELDAAPNCRGTVRAIRYMRQRAIELHPEAGYSGTMTTKQKVIKAVQALPDDASFEDAMERLLFMAKVEKGLQQADAGQTIPHEKVQKTMKTWLK